MCGVRPARIVPDPPPRNMAALLLLEWLLLFVGFPLLAWADLLPVGIFVIFAVPVAYALLVAFFTPRPVREHGPPSWPRFGLAMLAVASLVFLVAALGLPERFLILPRERPLLWVQILLLYPLVSALPQEFLYRRFYFDRYRRLFPTRGLAAASNIFAFSFLHIIFDNGVAVAFTLAGGTLFTLTYLRTQRLALVWLEHSVYGLAIFTSGLGLYFYSPPPAP